MWKRKSRSVSPLYRGQYDLAKLDCYGCAHSVASAPHPGYPSGEYACLNCVRAYKHDDYGLYPNDTDKDMYIPLDRRYGICDCCSEEKSTLMGAMCTDCLNLVEEARNMEI